MTKSRKKFSLEQSKVGMETLDWTKVTPRYYKKEVYANLRHYNYFYTPADSFNWAKAWLKEGGYDILSSFEKTNATMFSTTAGFLAKMGLNGAQLSKDHTQFILKKCKENLEHLIPEHKKPQIQASIQNKASYIIARLDEVLDENKPFDVTSFLQIENVSKAVANLVKSHYEPGLKELQSTKGKDALYMSRKEVKSYISLLESIVADCERYGLNQNRASGPRRASYKPKSATKLPYLPYDKKTNVKSKNPTTIIGADEIYLFIPETRQLTFLKSSSHDGFNVKGSTVQHIDKEASSRKIVRANSNVIAEILKSRKKGSKTAFDNLTTRGKDATGRVNSKTLILAVYK